MSVIAEFTLPADQSELGRILEVGSGVQVRLEPIVPTSDVAVPYFWVEAPDHEAIETTLSESDLVDEVRVVDEADDETLFRVQWAAGNDGFIEAVSETDAALLDGQCYGDHWSFQLRFPDHETLSAFYRDVVDRDVSVTLDGTHNSTTAPGASEFGLSPEQHEALSVALQAGYFDVPREMTLVELADELDISDSAVSQRIRRGLAKILSATVDAETERANGD